MSDSSADETLDSTVLIAIVIGSTGVLLMALGAVYYFSRLGDVPTRRSIADETSAPPSVNIASAANTPTTDNNKREELIEIYAPAGKLGVILETPPGRDGPPLVHEIRPTSVLKDEMQVGDRVIALDDEDVRQMLATKVSKLISQKMDNTTRKFSILRTVDPDV